jgi:two-component system sensor histidine kinase QseC
MTGSLRVRLFVVLMVATSIIWLAAVAWITTSSRREVEQVLDRRLQEAARMVISLVEDLPSASSGNPGTTALANGVGSYERQLSCQIWALNGHMIARSSGAPQSPLTDQAAGFSEREVDGEPWRVYSVQDEAKGVRVLVGDRLGLREQLVTDLIKGLLWPALLIAPLLGLLIWISLGRGLSPLRYIARDLASREAEDMRPVNPTSTPSEIRPLADAINGLFDKVGQARAHEREVTAFAAHELRTPLAGLKTQAQVALAAEDPAVMRKALRQILVGVDRSARLVAQLLTIARLDAGADAAVESPVVLGALIEDVADAAVSPDGLAVEIDQALMGVRWNADAASLELAFRNLHENALQYGRQSARWSWDASSASVILEDDGPGIPPDELPKVGTRFFRGRFKSAVGSGLGLAIARKALERANAHMTLRERADSPGLRVEIRAGRPLV